MQEYWVNVYENFDGSKWYSFYTHLAWKIKYRIHVKMKPVNLTPDCDKPDEVSRAYAMLRERGILDCYRAGY